MELVVACPDTQVLGSEEGVFPLDPNLLQLAGVALFADWIFTSGVFRLD